MHHVGLGGPHMKLLTRSMLLGSLGLAAAIVGRDAAAAEPGHEANTESAPACGTKPATSSLTAEKTAPSRGHHDMVALVGEVINQLSLTDDQRKAVDALLRTTADATSEGRAARDLIKQLGEQIPSGHVDADALQPTVDAFVQAAGCSSPAKRE